MDFRFTLFNNCTLLVVALTVAACFFRFRAGLGGNWPILYYVVAIAYSVGFRYSLNPYALFAGLAIALMVRIWKLEVMRWGEIPIYVYVLGRGLVLLAGW